MICFPFDSQITGYDDSGAPVYDRAATSDQLADWFAHYFTNGVFQDSDGTPGFAVTAAGGMAVSIAPGACQINGRYAVERSATAKTLSGVSATSGRVDLVVLRLNLETDVRAITIEVVQGAAAASPTAPYDTAHIKRNDTIWDLVLAEITIPSGTTEITASMIRDMRTGNMNRGNGQEACCGIVQVPLKTFDLSDIYAQYESDYKKWLSQLQAILDDDAAGKLATAVTNLERIVGYDKDTAENGTIDTRIAAGVSTAENIATRMTTLYNASALARFNNGSLSGDAYKGYDACIVYFRNVSDTEMFKTTKNGSSKNTNKKATTEAKAFTDTQPTVSSVTVPNKTEEACVLVLAGRQARATYQWTNGTVLSRGVFYNPDSGTLSFTHANVGGANGDKNGRQSVYVVKPFTYSKGSITGKYMKNKKSTSITHSYNLAANSFAFCNDFMVPCRVIGVKFVKR